MMGGQILQAWQGKYNILKKIFGSRNERLLKQYGKTVLVINGFEPQMQSLSDEQLAAGNMALIFGVSFVLCLVTAFVFAMFLGPRPPLALGLGAGFSAGLCWVGASFGINYLFERKSLKLFLINAGYHTLQFTLIGLILALWPLPAAVPA